MDAGLGVRTVSGGVPCDLVTVPARQGLEAVDILRLRDGLGPVLLCDGDADENDDGAGDGCGDRLGFLVPPGTAACWDLPGSACTQTPGRPRTVAQEPPLAGRDWLVPPEWAYGVATDASLLRAALGEAARTIAAAGRSESADADGD
ncbi:hypothetical protein K378_00927 [Streptomyces sp. Amel2xB2]|uniref:hypothetical protein n=1 Tax=Streptomyces sp. Amel2xB2 TaxID=1305829 RepID=UPI000DB937C7|nr:hypothetical protein [Streptomyces sp. Amel2xB2]RAJ69772.1 hypothetical protein K378_00927 [Streptomyces sp. Amel2xB2]